MTTIPPELDPSNLLNGEWPKDTTLAVAGAAFKGTEAFRALIGISRHPERIRIRFFVDGEEADPEMLLGEFQQLARCSRASIAIDDGEGGVAAKIPETV